MLDRCPTGRILITRLSALGDCLLTLPLVNAVRDHFPSAHIAWAMEPLAARLLANHPSIDQVISVPKGWLKSPRTVAALRRQIRGSQFQVSIDPQSLTKSSMLGWLGNVRHRIGFASPAGRELAPWLNNELIRHQATHLVDASLQLLAPFGIDSPAVRFDVPIDPEADRRMERFLKQSLVTRDFMVANCGASCPSKVWPPERFGHVARFLGETCGVPTVVTWAGDVEHKLATRVIPHAGGHAILAPATSLPELAAILRRARLAIAADTGPLHLAATLGTACVGLYGPTRPAWSGPYGVLHRTLQVQRPIPKRRRQRRLDDSAMCAITVDVVNQAAQELLQCLSRSGCAANSAWHAA